jgi:hypothetical protein
MELTMVQAQAYLKAGKTRKSEVLDDFCEGEGYCRRHAARVLQQAGQRSLLGEEILVATPRSICTGTVLPGMALQCRRH